MKRYLAEHPSNTFGPREIAAAIGLAPSTVQGQLNSLYRNSEVVRTKGGKYQISARPLLGPPLETPLPNSPGVLQNAAQSTLIDLEAIRQSLARVNYNLCRILNARLDERATRGVYLYRPSGIYDLSGQPHPLAELWGIAEESLVLVRKVEESYGFLKRKKRSILSLRRTKYYGYKSFQGVSWYGRMQDIPLYLNKVEEALGDLEEQEMTGIKGLATNMRKRVREMRGIYESSTRLARSKEGRRE